MNEGPYTVRKTASGFYAVSGPEVREVFSDEYASQLEANSLCALLNRVYAAGQAAKETK